MGDREEQGLQPERGGVSGAEGFPDDDGVVYPAGDSASSGDEVVIE